MIQEKIRQKILEKGISLKQLGVNDIAWERQDAIDLINSLMNENISVLGGRVYSIRHGRPIPLYDNWSYEPMDNETREEYSLRSKIKSLQYIERYPKNTNDTILFSLGFDDFFDTSLAEDFIDESEASNPLGVANLLAAENLTWLVKWYNHECVDGCGRLQITLEEGPSWYFVIDIQKTRLADKVFPETTIERSQDNWACCFVKDGLFQGYGGSKNLPELLQIFHQWVNESERVSSESTTST